MTRMACCITPHPTFHKLVGIGTLTCPRRSVRVYRFSSACLGFGASLARDSEVLSVHLRYCCSALVLCYCCSHKQQHTSNGRIQPFLSAAISGLRSPLTVHLLCTGLHAQQESFWVPCRTWSAIYAAHLPNARCQKVSSHDFCCYCASINVSGNIWVFAILDLHTSWLRSPA